MLAKGVRLRDRVGRGSPRKRGSYRALGSDIPFEIHTVPGVLESPLVIELSFVRVTSVEGVLGTGSGVRVI